MSFLLQRIRWLRVIIAAEDVGFCNLVATPSNYGTVFFVSTGIAQPLFDESNLRVTCFGVLISQLDINSVCVCASGFTVETLLKYRLYSSLHIVAPVLRPHDSSAVKFALTSKNSVPDGIVLTYGIVDWHAYP